ncbi:MAG: 30S ribosomal protein S17 [Parcubacteria group bacterium GW2011_GWA2_45_30]|nr:MAG: 30S ribosomal protein S17 [Parcubacteria group bacterium GW2011_GWA2_45_30]
MRKLKGIVTSDKMQKTLVVRVDRLKKHPKYGKYFRMTQKFKAHDEKGEYRAGDVVIIQETRPLSKDKRWKVTELVKRVSVAGEDESVHPSNDD